MAEFQAVTAEQVVAKLQVDDRFAVNCLLQLYARQTADEQAAETTSYRNGVGFNACDAEILSSFAQQAAHRRRQREVGEIPEHWTDLSLKQMALLRRKLPRYQRQLAELTNDALRRKAEAADAARADGYSDEEFARLEAEAQRLAAAACAACGVTIPDRQANRAGHCVPCVLKLRETHRKFVETFGSAVELAAFDAETEELGAAHGAALPGTVAEDCLPSYEGTPEVRETQREDPVGAFLEAQGVLPRDEELPPVNGFDVPPSCRLIQNGADLRFPTAKELAEGGLDQGARRLQRGLADNSLRESNRLANLLDEGEDIFANV